MQRPICGGETVAPKARPMLRMSPAATARLICGGDGRQHRASEPWRSLLQQQPGNEAPYGAFFLGGLCSLSAVWSWKEVRQVRSQFVRKHFVADSTADGRNPFYRNPACLDPLPNMGLLDSPAYTAGKLGLVVAADREHPV